MMGLKLTGQTYSLLSTLTKNDIPTTNARVDFGARLYARRFFFLTETDIFGNFILGIGYHMLL
jgi:hypothetical protein